MDLKHCLDPEALTSTLQAGLRIRLVFDWSWIYNSAYKGEGTTKKHYCTLNQTFNRIEHRLRYMRAQNGRLGYCAEYLYSNSCSRRFGQKVTLLEYSGTGVTFCPYRLDQLNLFGAISSYLPFCSVIYLRLIHLWTWSHQNQSINQTCAGLVVVGIGEVVAPALRTNFSYAWHPLLPDWLKETHLKLREKKESGNLFM